MLNFYNLGRQVGAAGLAYRLTALADYLKMQLHAELKAMNAAADKKNRLANAVAHGRAMAYADALEFMGMLVKMKPYEDVYGCYRLDDYCVDGEFVGLKK